jgi:2-phospho-L-lactate/phosphoenolpyruvate guanylyltransferase
VSGNATVLTGWTALVPFKQGGGGKSRLAGDMSARDRDALSLNMVRHVLAELAKVNAIKQIVILTSACPDWWEGAWALDEGRGLNPEIAAWRTAHGVAPMLVIHGDLPLLRAAEVEQVLAAATQSGAALATDRQGQGTNALALADGRAMAFRFGPDSRVHHAAQWPDMPVLSLEGLAADIDTADDLAFARLRGLEL